MIQYIYRGTTKVLSYIWDILKWPWQGTTKILGYIWNILKLLWQGTTKVLGYIWDILEWLWQGTTKVLCYIWDILKWLWQNVYCCIRCIVQKIRRLGVWCWQYRCIRYICWPVQKIWQFGVWCFNWVWPGSYTYVDCQILDKRWINELQQYRSIYLKPACECPSICQAISNHLPDNICETEDQAAMTVIVTKKTTRVQSDAETALERVKFKQDHKNRTILMMFHRVMGSKSVEDVTSIMYSCPLVYRTFHIPYSTLE